MAGIKAAYPGKNLKKAESILNFSSFDKLSEFYKINFKERRKQCVLDSAGNCKYSVANECSGTCLDYV